MTDCCQIDSRAKGPNCLLACRTPRAPWSCSNCQVSICRPAVPPPPHKVWYCGVLPNCPNTLQFWLQSVNPKGHIVYVRLESNSLHVGSLFYLTTVDCHFLSSCLLHQLTHSSDIPHTRRSIGWKWQTMVFWYNKHPVYIQASDFQISRGISWLTEDLLPSQEGPCSMSWLVKLLG
jgi:hypothetical protein